MSPLAYQEGEYQFYFKSFDVISGEDPHVHVARGRPNPARDAKLWLTDPVTVAKKGRFRRRDLNRVLDIANANRQTILERWHQHAGSAG